MSTWSWQTSREKFVKELLNRPFCRKIDRIEWSKRRPAYDINHRVEYRWYHQWYRWSRTQLEWKLLCNYNGDLFCDSTGLSSETGDKLVTSGEVKQFWRLESNFFLVVTFPSRGIKHFTLTMVLFLCLCTVLFWNLNGIACISPVRL